MHRSGTSAITRVLSLLGADLPGELLEPVPGVNETGFWESAKLVQIHDRMLEAAGSAWDDPREFPVEFFETAQGAAFSDEILGVLEEDFSDSSLFVIKDPRICRFVPFWIKTLRAFGARTLPLLLHRNPLEVAASLARRDDFDSSKSLNLWLRHVLDMEKATRGMSRTFMDYEALLRDWSKAVDRARADLAMDWPRSPDEVSREVEAFLSPSLRHHSRTATDMASDPAVSPWVSDAFGAFRQLVDNPQSSRAMAQLVRVRVEFDRASSAFGTLIGGQQQRSLERKVEEQESELETLGGRLSEAERSLAERQADFERHNELLEQSHASDKEVYEAEIERVRGLLDEFDERVKTQSVTIQELAASADELLSTNQDLAARQEELKSLTAEDRRKNRERIEALEEQTREFERETRELAERIELQEALRERTARSAERLDDEKSRVESELTEAQTKLEKVLQDKYWLYEQWQTVKQEMDDLRGSKVGRSLLASWSGYLGLRNASIRAAARLRQSPKELAQDALEGSRRIAEWLLRAPTRALRKIISLSGKGLGWLVLAVSTSSEQVASRFRRGTDARSVETVHEPGPTLPSRSIAQERRPRVLMVSPYSIYPPSHGGAVRLFNLIRRLSEHCDLHLIVFTRSDDEAAQQEALAPHTTSLHFHRWEPDFSRGRLGLEAPSQRLFHSDELARRIARLLSEERIDILQLEYTELGQYGLPRFSRVKVAMSEIDVAFRSLARRRREGFHERFESSRAFGHSYSDWMRQLRYELRVVRRADQIQMMSAEDADFLASYLTDGHRRLRVVPNAVDMDIYKPTAIHERDHRLLFVGNFEHLPNLDAIEHFFSDIWPEIQRRRPGTEISIVGANTPDSLDRFDDLDGVEVVGEVPDLAPYYRHHRALVAPIRAGSGTRLKILEAFACGAPVISSRLGAEGIDVRHRQHLLIADDPVDFARAAVSALDDDDLCVTLAQNCRRLVEERYTWEASAALQLAGYEELLQMSSDHALSIGAREMGPALRGGETPAAEKHFESNRARGNRDVDISIVIPTYNGGDRLRECLSAISLQQTVRSFEVICIDSGSADQDLEAMQELGVRLIPIDKAEFDHGLTRDRGASAASGEVLVFLNQDAIPASESWLASLTEPLFTGTDYAAVQGEMQELPQASERFYWDSGGDRFYFTRESERWIERFFGIGFSTVNAAMRREVWEEIPFGQAPIMEDKLWQRRAVERGASILYQEEATVFHSHDYDVRALVRRCQSEGFGWSFLGEEYSFLDMTKDMMQPRIYADLGRGLAQRRVRSAAELLFPVLRPLALYWGNHWSRRVKH
jgi:rhamnosyltransferase